jgi:predicted regulator of Ras-like GTPase activity (Roadblock/LC7/MglB family)
MPLHYILANLLANNPGAVGALLLDDTGETVDLACADFSPHEVKVAGAYLGITLRNMGRLLSEGDLGEPQVLHIEKNGIQIHAMALPEGYFLALLVRSPALIGQARKTLGAAVDSIQREVFTPRDRD